jgi:glycosyltransferase involved in cell wall biosynthesis
MSDFILTVVVPSYNSEVYIEECLKSIEREAQDGVEFILVDGASSDQTMAIVRQYAHLFSHVISESDEGQSDAFNKGFSPY